jgi:hypothetical protein
VDIEGIKRIITDQRYEIDHLYKSRRLIERDLPEDKLIQSLKHPNILAVLGVRRCGKSVCSHMLLKGKEYRYINFDDERLYGMDARDLNLVLQAFYELYSTELEYFMLDEIQNVSGWELFANRLRRTKKVVLTGSNAKLLSGELATHLTGRYSDVTLFPFSFYEFLEFKEIEPDIHSTRSIARIKNALKEYMDVGGFPEVYLFGKEVTARIYENIIYKDIISRHDIRNKRSFSQIAKYLVSNFSGEFSYRKLCGATSIRNVHTVKDYVGYLESSYIVLVVERFSFKLKEQIKAPRKVYCIDTGMINNIAFRSSHDIGKLMENLVAVELHRRKSYYRGDDVFYWKDHQQREVDFVLIRGEKVSELIQVSYTSSKEGIKDREFKGILRAAVELGCGNMKIITWDYEGDVGDVKCIPLWKWLLVDFRYTDSTQYNI